MRSKNTPRVIATLPPHVSHRGNIIADPRVDALRFNTVSPYDSSRGEMLERLNRECGMKRLWLDLKGRQLRIAKFAYMPFAYVELTHSISVDVPTTILFRDGAARVVEVVDGNKLILADRPPRVVGEGEPVNILDASLRIDGYLTDADREYVEAATSLGMHDYMLSFAEDDADIAELRDLDPKANIIAKIESVRGLAWMKETRLKKIRFMAARDDLYVNMGAQKTGLIPALEGIIARDRTAIVASRVLESLETSETVAWTDIADIELMLRLGYRTFMLSDTLCFRRQPFLNAMDVMEEMFGRMEETR